MKAVLVMDMPTNCSKCKLIFLQGIGEAICNAVDWDDRPSWCPLRPLPQRKGKYGELHQYDTDFHYEIGWNECLDEIMGRRR